ncbi:hypothetical protein GCM10017674_32680 [Streptomyces gardneri]|nr:hypothetical protein GCM10017674_32680 [Streptomyces gardneri]
MARTVTPVAMASCINRTCANTRRGQPNRRRRARGRAGPVCAGLMREKVRVGDPGPEIPDPSDPSEPSDPSDPSVPSDPGVPDSPAAPRAAPASGADSDAPG